jgi:murein lipoprotein
MSQYKKTLSMLLLTTGAALFCGCATHSDVRKAQNDATNAQRTADQALTTAQQAKSMAQEANDRSYRAEEMLNRGFKRSMRK